MANEPRDMDPTEAPEWWEALARFVAGESPAAEAASIRAWLDADPSRRRLMEALERATVPLRAPPAGLDIEAALQRVHERMTEAAVVPFPSPRARERRPSRWRMTAVRAAAAVVLVLGAGLVWRAVREGGGPAPTVVAASMFATRPGQIDSVRLADGTTVLLGPASRLTVADGYGAARREVELDGEALFDVVHDVDRPFSVRAGTATIVDLGTSFAVRSAATGVVRVVVTSGSVLLHAAATPADSGVILRAGDRGVLADGRASAERDVPLDADLAWTRGRLVFEDAPLARVAEEFRRWYGLELRLADSSLSGRHITTTFERETAREALDVLGLVLGVRIEQRGDTAWLGVPGGAAR
jgi:transmembrane sensor